MLMARVTMAVFRHTFMSNADANAPCAIYCYTVRLLWWWDTFYARTSAVVAWRGWRTGAARYLTQSFTAMRWWWRYGGRWWALRDNERRARLTSLCCCCERQRWCAREDATLRDDGTTITPRLLSEDDAAMLCLLFDMKMKDNEFTKKAEPMRGVSRMRERRCEVYPRRGMSIAMAHGDDARRAYHNGVMALMMKRRRQSGEVEVAKDASERSMRVITIVIYRRERRRLWGGAARERRLLRARDASRAPRGLTQRADDVIGGQRDTEHGW